MPTISAKIINPRIDRRCESYAHWCKDDLMPKGKPQMRLYGNGCSGDPKYTMYICLGCASKSDDPKIKEALAAYNQAIINQPKGEKKMGYPAKDNSPEAEKARQKQRIPEYFYKETDGGHPAAYTVAELKMFLSELPDELPVEHGFEKGVQLIVYNINEDDRHLGFQENEMDY